VIILNKIIVKGKVQGVHYRLYVKEGAIKNNINGFVKNLDDGSVEIVAKGAEKDMESFIYYCKKGNNWSIIEDFEIFEINKKVSFSDFKIIKEHKKSFFKKIIYRIFRKSAQS
jgi:acylphosphatase